MFKNHLIRHGRPLQFEKFAGLMLGEDMQVENEDGPAADWRPNWWI